ncbi:1,2-phenylacetyl-CoA epoxidase subunit PaaD [Thermaerobacter composti]|uniref:1,2-phenylacetyl-CoA epoxidase subunit PaaD n=1 Tax=Thermaerobacter composti TaxID=554949 RepID=A0ABZ0QN23_9FIRM|nr:1,2-phenylacetyl-CoA epoxidase subunit PaaD [Thermaerobacter composti]WPD18884.1 1,2-phenylacetyl-CoA epoxidase subunit PaaD [Thermaerobacter composti]
MATAAPPPAKDGGLVEALWAALAEVPDPEIPVVSVVDLGMVERLEADGDGTVRVTLLPTFVGCPALELIRQDVARRLAAVTGVRRVEVRVAYSPPWSTDRITPAGRRKLAAFGIAPPAAAPAAAGGACRAAQRLAVPVPPPAPGGSLATLGGGRAAPGGEPRTGVDGVPCPLCGSRRTRMENAFGPTPCRSLWYCLDCRNPFEQMKAL